MLFNILLYLQSAFYIYAGYYHFKNPKFYLKMMPSYMPAHDSLVFWSGVAEIALGIGLLIPQSRALCAWGIIAMLLVFIPIHVYMLISGKFTKIPKWFLYWRFPLQLLFIYWAYIYT